MPDEEQKRTIEDDPVAELLGDTPIDRFDQVQLAEVIRVCRASRSLSDAGHTLFAASRAQRTSVNDADRLRKYLARFGLDWEGLGGGEGCWRGLDGTGSLPE